MNTTKPMSEELTDFINNTSVDDFIKAKAKITAYKDFINNTSVEDFIKAKAAARKVKLNDFIDNAKVGDIIKVKFKDGNEYELVKYHNGVIGTRDCPFDYTMNDSPFDHEKDFHRDEYDWETSELKSYIEEWFESNAPDELKELCSVTIPCGTNIWGDENQCLYYNDDESEIQWDYFKDWHHRIKTILSKNDLRTILLNPTKKGWRYWTKSPLPIYEGFAVVGACGCADGALSIGDSNGVALCFLKK